MTGLRWDEAASRWIVETDRGDRFTATYLAMGTGPLHVAKLPASPASTRSRATPSTPAAGTMRTPAAGPTAPMDRLADKRVAIIGTGATAVQCVPHLARAAGELYVFQRTPSSVDVRDNRPTDPDWFAEIATPGWQQRWLENFAANQSGALPGEDLVQDGWTDLARRVERILTLAPEDFTPEKMMEAFEDSDFEKMEEIRTRVDSVVDDRDTAQKLKAWYRQLCKRPCFHDEYLDAYNAPNTHLVDTDGQGVERITETGVVVAGVEYPVDCIVYASGFEVGTDPTSRAGYDPVGRGGRRLSEHWASGMRSLHGVHVHGFPNMFLVQPAQGANLISNVPHNLSDAAVTIAAIVRHALDEGGAEVEVTGEAEDAWMELLGTGMTGILGSLECTPGTTTTRASPSRLGAAAGLPTRRHGLLRLHRRLAALGTFEGLEIRSPPDARTLRHAAARSAPGRAGTGGLRRPVSWGTR